MSEDQQLIKKTCIHTGNQKKGHISLGDYQEAYCLQEMGYSFLQ